MNGLPPPRIAVGGVVIDRRGAEPQVLLIKRGRPPMEGRWSLPGGRVEPGETLVQAVRREILEETGLDVEVGALIEVVEIIDPAHHYVILDYVCEPRGGVLRPGDDAIAAEMVRIADLSSYDVTEAVLRVVTSAVAMTAASP